VRGLAGAAAHGRGGRVPGQDGRLQLLGRGDQQVVGRQLHGAELHGLERHVRLHPSDGLCGRHGRRRRHGGGHGVGGPDHVARGAPGAPGRSDYLDGRHRHAGPALCAGRADGQRRRAQKIGHRAARHAGPGRRGEESKGRVGQDRAGGGHEEQGAAALDPFFEYLHVLRAAHRAGQVVLSCVGSFLGARRGACVQV